VRNPTKYDKRRNIINVVTLLNKTTLCTGESKLLQVIIINISAVPQNYGIHGVFHVTVFLRRVYLAQTIPRDKTSSLRDYSYSKHINLNVSCKLSTSIRWFHAPFVHLITYHHFFCVEVFRIALKSAALLQLTCKWLVLAAVYESYSWVFRRFLSPNRAS